MADRLKDPSNTLHDSGNSAVDQISRVKSSEARDMLRNMIGATQDQASFAKTVTEITNFLALMTGVEVISAPLRNALKPARIGITKIQDAVRIVERWGSVA
jgi:phage-related tail protein